MSSSSATSSLIFVFLMLICAEMPQASSGCLRSHMATWDIPRTGPKRKISC